MSFKENVLERVNKPPWRRRCRERRKGTAIRQLSSLDTKLAYILAVMW